VIANSGVLYFVDSSNNVVRKIERGAAMGREDPPKLMCKSQSGVCKIKRQCRDLSGALCAYRPDPCLIDDTCLCDVLFHNATCNEKVFKSGAVRGMQLGLAAAAAVFMAAAWPAGGG